MYRLISAGGLGITTIIASTVIIPQPSKSTNEKQSDWKDVGYGTRSECSKYTPGGSDWLNCTYHNRQK